MRCVSASSTSIEPTIRRHHWRSRSTTRSAAVAGSGALRRLRTAEDARTRAQLREFQRDQRAGRYIQMGMLPPSPMAIERYRLRHKLFPSLMLSGDFVDYFRITDRHFAFYMADVSGHGASSAFVTVLLKNFSRRLRREYRPKMLKAPGEILAALNRELLDNQLDKHVAIFIGVIDLADDTLAYANGGHFPAAILCDDSGCRYLEVAGKPVGLFEGVSWVSNREPLRGPLTLAMVSDGVLEIMGAGAARGEGTAPAGRGRTHAIRRSRSCGRCSGSINVKPDPTTWRVW